MESKIASWNATDFVESDTLELLIKYKSPAEISTPVRYKILKILETRIYVHRIREWK